MNIYKLSVAISAVLIVASCSKEININEPGTGNEITVRSKVSTKAGYTSQSLPSEFVMDIIQGETGYNYSNVIMYADPSTGTYKAKSSQGNNIALKWANSNHSGAQVKAMTIPSGVATTLDDYQVHIDIEENQTTEANFKKNDILGAGIGTTQKGVTIEADDIILDFSHLMSKLHVVYETDNKEQTVEYIKLRNVCTDGYYSYKNMIRGQSGESRNEINMFLNPSVKYGTKAAEAIFYPYAVGNTNKPQLVVKLSGSQEKVYNIPVSNGFSFAEGKRYLLNIKISSDGTISANGTVSSDYNWVKNVPGGKILWVGTSIPAGSVTNNYPKMIANATGLEIINNAIAATKVLREPLTTITRGDDTYTPFQWIATKEAFDYKRAGGLSQTKQEAEQIYRDRLMTLSQNDKVWVDEQILAIQSLSYESLIIPYIDGTLDDCQTIVIDHGFNDLWGMDSYCGMLWEAREFYRDVDATYGIWGTIVLDLDINSYNSTYVPIIKNPENCLTEEGSYLMCMERIINAIYKANPNAKIIIGNYFGENNPWVIENMSWKYPYFNLTGTLWCYNWAVANIWGLDIVQVYQHIGNIDWNKFCIDGVHPSSDETGNSNRRIADVYLSEFSRIFGGTNTKTISNTAIPSWEDVEI